MGGRLGDVAAANLIAVIEKHKVKSGETLKSLAEAHGLTWQQLALFNWNTDDQDDINNHLRDDVGCTKKSPDGNNYVFSSDDSPGIICVPTKWVKAGLPTDQTHMIRVRPFRVVQSEEAYVISAEVRSIGDTLLVNHDVRIIDPDTLEQVGDTITTGDDAVVRAIVPQNKKYRIEIQDHEFELHVPELLPDDVPAVLLCHFVDASGTPLANLTVEASSGDDKFELVTDGNGRLEALAHLRPYDLKVGDRAFQAHALLMKDRERDESLYRFVVESSGAQGDEDGEPPECRLARFDVAAEDQDSDA